MDDDNDNDEDDDDNDEDDDDKDDDKDNVMKKKGNKQFLVIDDNKKDDNDDDDDDDDDDDEIDLAELFVTGGDDRVQIYESRQKNKNITHCIGSLKIFYAKKDIGGGAVIGTGTIFHVDKNRCFVITCAHNIRAKSYQCQKKSCLRRMLSNNIACDRCGGNQFKKKTKLYKAKRVQFFRRSIEENSFGAHQDDYECDMNQVLMNDIEYTKWPHPRSGHDICILTIDDEEAVKYYKDKCEKIRLVNQPQLFGNNVNIHCQMHLFGYPGDKKYGKEMWGMSTAKQNELKIEKNDEKDNNESYIVNTEIDTFAGQSGACFYCCADNDNDTFWINGIHTGGNKKMGQNYGTFLNYKTLKWIESYFENINVSIKNKIIPGSPPWEYIYDTNKTKVNTSTNTITSLLTSYLHYKHNAVFIDDWIDNKQKNKVITWTVKINKSWWLSFGISSVETKRDYSFNNFGDLEMDGSPFRKTNKFSDGDTLSISLYSSQLLLKKNNEPEFVLFPNVKPNKYKFRIDLQSDAGECQIMDISEYYVKDDIKSDEAEQKKDSSHPKIISLSNGIDCKYNEEEIEIDESLNTITSRNWMNTTYIGTWFDNMDPNKTTTLKIKINKMASFSDMQIGFVTKEDDNLNTCLILSWSNMFLWTARGRYVTPGLSSPYGTPFFENDIISISIGGGGGSSSISCKINDKKSRMETWDNPVNNCRVKKDKYKFALSFFAPKDECKIIEIVSE